MKRTTIPQRIAREANKQAIRNLTGLPPRDDGSVARSMAEILKRQANPDRPSPMAHHQERMDRLRREALTEVGPPVPETVVKARRR